MLGELEEERGRAAASCSEMDHRLDPSEDAADRLEEAMEMYVGRS